MDAVLFSVSSFILLENIFLWQLKWTFSWAKLSWASFEPPKALVCYRIILFGEFDEKRRKKRKCAFYCCFEFYCFYFVPELCRGKGMGIKISRHYEMGLTGLEFWCQTISVWIIIQPLNYLCDNFLNKSKFLFSPLLSK